MPSGGGSGPSGGVSVGSVTSMTYGFTNASSVSSDDVSDDSVSACE
jgi:hypothetical protein